MRYLSPRRWPGSVRALLGYLAATLLFFNLALPQMGRAFPGGPVAATDGWQHVWHLWWAARALARGESPLFTPMLYHPSGVNLAIHPLNLSNGLLFWPITALAGPIAAYNAALLTAFSLAGLGAYLLARQVGARPGASFVAGLLFSFAPFHTTKAYDGQLEMVALQWLPLYVWLLLRAMTGRGWPAALGAGLLLGVIGYTSLYYLVYTAVFSAAFALLWLPLRGGPRAMFSHLGRLAIVPLVAGLALAPLLLQLSDALAEITGGAPGNAPAEVSAELVSRSANLLDFWLPSYLHPLWGQAVARLGPWLHPDISAWNHALGYCALALALVGLAGARAVAWRWAALALLGLILALGPTLNVGGLRSDLALPYRLLLGIPGMAIAQRPGHFVVLTVLALVPLSALGLEWLATRYGRRALGAALLLAAVELAPPAWPLQRLAVHPAIGALGAGSGAVLSLPVVIDSSEPLREQLAHGRPLVGGYLARTPPYPFAELTPGVRQLWRLAPDGASLADPAGASSLDLLAAYNLRDVVVRWSRIPPGQQAAARAAIAMALPGLAPAYADPELSIYHIPAGAGQPFAYFGRGWYAEERQATQRWRWMQGDGELLLVNPATRPVPFTLRLRAESLGRARDVAMALNGAALGDWAVSAQPRPATTTLRLLLPPGLSRLSLRAATDPDPGGRGPLSIVVSGLEVVRP